MYSDNNNLSTIQQKKDQLSHIAAGLKVIADSWSLMIIEILRSEPQRFSTIEKITQINTRTLSKRLKNLEKFGIISKLSDEKNKVAVFYSLTPKGKKALCIIDRIVEFTSENL